jgi:ATP-dependent helicase/nuclease subunit A
MRVRVAGAGTGKTTSLVVRYLELVATGVPLRRVAGVTYTRASAAELRERVGDGIRQMLVEGAYLGDLIRLAPETRHRFEEAARELDGAAITTIHGFLAAALRLVAPSLGLDPDFGMVGEWEAKATLDEELQGLRYVAELPGHEEVAALVRAAGEDGAARVAALFAQRSLAADFRPAGAASAAVVALFESAYDRYRARLGPSALAPAELEREALRLVAAPVLAARVAARYPVVLVDEFQDVNPLQGTVFERLERAGARLEVVGDPKQSIYGFRHADVGVFRRVAATAREARTLDPPLTRTRRHAQRVAAFLNHLTDELARRDLGFGVLEAPPLVPAGSQAQRAGAVECLWWRDTEADLPTLRRAEAAALAERLAWWGRDGGVAFRDMAVLARSRRALALAHEALAARGVPSVLRQGRGFFERIEVRDLFHAVRVALHPSGASLAAWLRGPFAALPPADVERVVLAPDPLAALTARHPAVAATWRATRAAVVGAPPLGALAALVREPLVAGRPLVAVLGQRERDNVDALLTTIAAERPMDTERLLDRLAWLAGDVEAGDMPQAGDGVQLLTLHASKGLEWPLVAVFDLGGHGGGGEAEVLVDPHAGVVGAVGDDAFEEMRRSRRAEAEAEQYRQLYVALSRARDVLILTGSHGRSTPSPWLRACNLAGIGPAGDGAAAHALSVRREVHGAHDVPPVVAAATAAAPDASRPPLAPWTGRRFRRSRYPVVVSPSWVSVEGAGVAPPGATRPGAYGGPSVALPGGDEPWRGEEDSELPGTGSAIGTLVHDAIARDWSPEDGDVARVLAAQEVLWPFAARQRVALVAEALELLRSYRAMLADGRLVPLSHRDEDHTELPFAFPRGGHVWQGVIDRYWRVGATWFLDDYKTDRRLDPDRYLPAMATYVEAVAAVHGVRPVARLVDLRRGVVLPLADAELRERWRWLGGEGVQPGSGARAHVDEHA